MAKIVMPKLTRATTPMDQPTMVKPTELVHRESEFFGGARYGFAMQIEGDRRGFGSTVGAKKGNRARQYPAPAERAEKNPFRNLSGGKP